MKPHRLGRLAKRSDPRTFKMARYMTAFPPLPSAIEWGGKVTAWGMLANDRVGDCTCAGAGHCEMLWTSQAGVQTVPSDADILTAYSAITGYDPTKADAAGNNPTDTGADLLTVLKYWKANGIAGSQIQAFVEVNPHNQQEVEAAIYLFGSLYCGVNLPQSAETDFDIGRWSNIHDQNIIGGHCVIAGGYNPTGVKLVTWGQEILATYPWMKTYCDEAFCILSDQWIEANGQAPSGFDLATLQADLAKL